MKFHSKIVCTHSKWANKQTLNYNNSKMHERTDKKVYVILQPLTPSQGIVSILNLQHILFNIIKILNTIIFFDIAEIEKLITTPT